MREVTYSWGAVQNKTISSSHQEFTAVGAHIRCVRLYADTLCYISIIGNAALTSTPLAAGVPEYIKVPKGGVVSVIGTSGSINLTECDQ